MAKKKKARPVKSSTLEKKKPAVIAARRKDHTSDDRKSAASVKGDKSAKAEKGDKKSRQIKSVVGVSSNNDGEKPSRLSLIKMRHEAIRREIDQIREDLESDEEE
jgi:hypothetical protein